eukprot:gene7770-8616_t
MTSLSSQLKSLQLPDELSVLNVQSKRASILFDSRDAADIDLDTVFSIGLSGLAELENIDSDFAKFEKFLFSDSVKSLERTQQPGEFNSKLDRKVEEFLAYLSPYFLIKPAQKTLEWLIRRFRIHVFNQDSLMACIFPYHETNLFARVLQILSFKQQQNNKWQWLIPVQKASSPLSKATIIQHCVHNVAFQSFISEMVLQAIQHNKGRSEEKLKTVISFYTSVLLGIVDSPKNLNENRVGKILPFIYKGLKSNVADFKSSSYMILSKLSLMITFEEQILLALTEQICKSLSGETAQFGILTMEYMYRKQTTKKFSTKALDSLCHSRETLDYVLVCADNNKIPNFQTVFLSALINHVLIATQAEDGTDDQSVNYELVAKTCLQNMNLAMATTQCIMKQFLEHHIKLREVSTTLPPLMSASHNLLKIFETRYPDATDAVLKEFLGKHTKKSELEYIESLVMVESQSTKYTIMPDTHMLLSVSLNHPHAERRKLAVKELAKRISLQQGNNEDLDFTRNALIQRLYDDDRSVFEEVLTIGSRLVHMVGIETLLECLPKKLTSTPFSDRTALVHHVIDIFQDYDFNDGSSTNINAATTLLYELLPNFIPSSSQSKQQLSLYTVFRDSKFAHNHVYFEGIRKSFKEYDISKLAEKSTHAHEFQLLVLENISEILHHNENRMEIIDASLIFAQTLPVWHPFRSFLFSLLFKLLEKLPSLDLVSAVVKSQKIVRSTVEFLTKMEGKARHTQTLLHDRKDEDVFMDCSKLAFSKQLDSHKDKNKFAKINMFCLFIKEILNLLPKVDECMDEDLATTKMQLQLFIFEVLATGSGRQPNGRPYVSVFRKLLQDFLKLNFGTPKILLDFLRSVFSDGKRFDWLSHEHTCFAQVEVQVCALHIFKVCLETLNKSAEETVKFESQALPILLTLLHHPLRVIREAAMGCIQALNDVTSDGNIDTGLKYLIGFIVSNDMEIVEDRSRVLSVLEKLFKPLSSTSSDREMLEPMHLENLIFLTKYFAASLSSPEIHVQLGICSITSSVVFQDFLVHLLPVLEENIQTAQTSGLQLGNFFLLKMLLKKFTPSTVDIFQKFPSSLKLFKTALELGNVCNDSKLTVQEIALEQVTCSFYAAMLSATTQSEVFDTILFSTVTTGSLEVSKAIRQKLVELPVCPEDVARQIFHFKESLEENNPKKAKRSRRMTKSKIKHEEAELADSPSWNRMMILLEVLQQKTNTENLEKFVVSLFDMLSCCLDIATASQSTVEYMKQLLLSSLQRCLDYVTENGSKGLLPQEKFKIAHVIQCCRTSGNPQTHHHALLLLGKAAKLFPDLVLHNIMTIFTFMGDSVLRQDDSYSFEIIKKTIDSVIPTLVMASSGSPDGVQRKQTDDIVKLVVRVFVDAIPYIPEHRRLILFEHLANVLNAEQNLNIVVSILLEKVLLQSQKSVSSNEQGQDSSFLSQNFCQRLVVQFPVSVQIETMKKLVQNISNLPDEKKVDCTPRRALRSQKPVVGELVPLFDANKHSTKEIRQFKYIALVFNTDVLSDENFISKASQTKDKDLSYLYLRFIEEVMQFVGKLGKQLESHPTESSVKFCKMLLQKGSVLLDKVYKLLKFKTFLTVTTKLVVNDNPAIRKKAMELIGDKIAAHADFTTNQEVKLLNLAQMLVGLSLQTTEETAVNKQTALYALKFLIRLLSKNRTDEIAAIVPSIISVFASENAGDPVRASGLLCLAELCACLETRVISFLPEFMPPVLNIFSEYGNKNELLLLGGITVLHKTVETIPQFLSPYITNILDILTRTSFGHPVASSKANSMRTQIVAKVVSIRKDFARLVEPRVFIPALETVLDMNISSEMHSFQSFMEIVQYCMEDISREDTKTYNGRILSLFLKALDIRSLNAGKSQQELFNLEGSVLNAFCTLVMKLSENLFRPMFLKIHIWATATDASKERLLTFYRFCETVADKLKGLFLLFAGRILKPCAELVKKCYTEKEDCGIFDTEVDYKTDLLLRFIFDCLRRCFDHDAQGFLNKERFKHLLEPLVDQIENVFGGHKMYVERITNHLIPCVSSFAADISEQSCWKTLNYRVLLKTRSQNAHVRLFALKLLEQIHKKIGESYMILLPETVPFLAELMEDENMEVEKQCQLVITQMEGILGESLQKYF